MLGTHLICDFTGGLTAGEPELSRETPDNSLPPLARRLVWQDRYSRLSCAAYADYPVFGCEDEDFLVHLEGRLYNMDDSRLVTELLDLARGIFRAPAGPESFATRWLLGVDGDFLLVLVSKADGRLAVINDIFGRLPTHFHLQDNRLILSRSLRLITNTLNTAAFDRMALAQYLLLGFPLGKRTWFTGIEQLEPATIITVSPGESSVRVARLNEFNFEAEEHGLKSLRENAGNLSALFRQACRRRAGAGENVVSLSGGLDSRAVAAGLRREEIPLAAASFLEHDRGNAGDLEAAARVARLLGLEWQSFSLPPARGQEVARLLALKNGANNLRMSFILPFFRQLRQSFGPGLAYFTGDGGGDALGDSWPHRPLPTAEALVDFLVERYQVWPLEEVAALTRLTPGEIKEEIAARLAAYPETTPARKYKHFFCLEVAVRMYHEGEDRNRRFFWSTAPFYASDFFHYALNCPDRDKQEYQLYREFLAQLHPGLEEIEYANWGAPVTSGKFRWLYRLKTFTRSRPGLVRRLRRVFKRYDRVEPGSAILACLAEQKARCGPLFQYLDARSLARVAANPRDYDKLELWTLFTLASTITHYNCPPAIGADFLDQDFV